MDKQTYLKAFYISQITALIERCADQSLLDLIYRLLSNEQN
jgi:hypothetical protein